MSKILRKPNIGVRVVKISKRNTMISGESGKKGIDIEVRFDEKIKPQIISSRHHQEFVTNLFSIRRKEVEKKELCV